MFNKSIVMRFIPLIFIILFSFSCVKVINSEDESYSGNQNVEDVSDSAQWVVNQALEVHGGDVFKQSEISFVFRDRKYTRIMEEGKFHYERLFTNPEDSSQQIRDILTNDGFSREINGEKVETDYKQDSMYSNSVNSVIYFAVLPYGLNDPAVKKKFLGLENIKGQEFYKIRVSFEEEGGGKDFEDVFLYYIHPRNFTLDYFAYLYYTDGGGIRFREVINKRKIGGIIFQDYNNYKMDFEKDLMDVAKEFNEGSLELLSEILLEDVNVNVLSL